MQQKARRKRQDLTPRVPRVAPCDGRRALPLCVRGASLLAPRLLGIHALSFRATSLPGDRAMSRSRRTFLSGAATAGAAALAAPSIARAQQSFNWKMTSAYAKGAPFYMDGPGSATDLAKRIEAMSSGRLKIQCLRRRRAHPGARGLRRRARRHGRDEPRQQLLLDRQDLRRAVLHGRALRPQLPGHERLALRRRRHRSSGTRSTRPSAWSPSPAATPACR